MSLLEMKNISFSYDGSDMVISDISIDINEGESVAIIGANGTGKSTLMRLMVGLELDFKGSISVNNKALNKKNLAEIRAEMGYVFQDAEAQLFMPRVYDDIAFAPRNYGYNEAEVQSRVDNALEKIGITHLKDRATHRLSGGEKKLVSIATIMSMEPSIILMDEPTITLDAKNRRNLINVLHSLPQCKIIATHDLNMVLDICERVIILKEGKIAADGEASDLLYNKRLLEECGLELPLGI